MINNPDRLVCGIATGFDTRSANGNLWSRSQWQEWLDLESSLPVLWNHGPLISSRGVIATIGTARRFAPIEYPVNGLLCLAEIDDAEGNGDSVLSELRSSLGIWAGRTVWGLSVGVHLVDDLVIPYEVSITCRPAWPDAKVLAVGQEAIETFDLLTEHRTAAR
jgi:hypothetical protein